MNENRKDQAAEPRDPKLPYMQPQLSKHGKVENLTQQTAPPNGISQPPISTET